MDHIVFIYINIFTYVVISFTGPSIATVVIVTISDSVRDSLTKMSGMNLVVAVVVAIVIAVVDVTPEVLFESEIETCVGVVQNKPPMTSV